MNQCNQPQQSLRSQRCLHNHSLYKLNIQMSKIKTYKFIKIQKEECQTMNNAKTQCKNKTTLSLSQLKINKCQSSHNSDKTNKILVCLLHKSSSNPSLTRSSRRRLSFTQVQKKSQKTGNTKIKIFLPLSKNILSTLISKSKVNAIFSPNSSDLLSKSKSTIILKFIRTCVTFSTKANLATMQQQASLMKCNWTK